MGTSSMMLYVTSFIMGLASMYVYREYSASEVLLSWRQALSRSLDQSSATTTSTDHLEPCKASDFLTTEIDRVPGFHVLCWDYKDDSQTKVEWTIYRDGTNRTGEIVSTWEVPQSSKNAVIWTSLRTHLANTAISPPSSPPSDNEIQYKQPWQLFSPTGKPLSSWSFVSETTKTVFLFEGGQFIWPGVSIGHRVQIKDIDGWGSVTLETLSLIPLVFRVEEFLSDEECKLIQELSLPHLKASGVALMDKDKGKPATEWRTSSTYFLPSRADPRLRLIDARCADLTKVPVSHQEDAQVLRYEKTQKYDAHHDFFSPKLYQSSPKVLKSIDYGFKNRMITVFWYMSDVAKGGHTIFPRAGGKPPPRSFKDCETGLKVAPKKRMVVIFYSMLPDGTMDEYSLHGGCPVEEGVKFAVNKWVWNKPRK